MVAAQATEEHLFGLPGRPPTRSDFRRGFSLVVGGPLAAALGYAMARSATNSCSCCSRALSPSAWTQQCA